MWAGHSTAWHGMAWHGAAFGVLGGRVQAAFWLTASVQDRQVVPNVFVGLAGALGKRRARRARRRGWGWRRVGRWRGPAQMAHSERRVEDFAAARWGACHRPAPRSKTVR